MHILDWYKGDEVSIASITEGIRRTKEYGSASAEAHLQTKSGKKIPFFFTARRMEIDGKTYLTGVGVPAGEKDRIFVRGYGKHTGLGLFLAKEILAITSITIRETGVPGHGARFEMLVPKGSYRLVKSP